MNIHRRTELGENRTQVERVSNYCQPQTIEAADNESAPSVEFIAQVWPHLSPHVREAILTLIDASLTSNGEGEQP